MNPRPEGKLEQRLQALDSPYSDEVADTLRQVGSYAVTDITRGRRDRLC